MIPRFKILFFVNVELVLCMGLFIDFFFFYILKKSFQFLVHLHMSLFWMVGNEDYVGLKLYRFWL